MMKMNSLRIFKKSNGKKRKQAGCKVMAFLRMADVVADKNKDLNSLPRVLD